MITRLLRSALLVAAAVVLTGVPAFARRDNDRRDNDRVVIVRDRYAGRPYGWNRGRKVGWGNCDLPPGLARKYGCRQGFSPRDRRIDRRPVIVVPLPFF